MNAKKAKYLRRAAREATVGRPNVAYAPGAQAILLTNCTRGIYQRFKMVFA